MKHRKVVLGLVVATIFVVLGILLAIGVVMGDGTGLDTDDPTGRSAGVVSQGSPTSIRPAVHE